MAAKPLEWSPKALVDVARETAYYSETASPLVADALRDAIKAASRRIQKNPAGYRPGIKAGTREYVMREFPLTLVYQIKPTHIRVLRVWHQSAKYFNR